MKIVFAAPRVPHSGCVVVPVAEERKLLPTAAKLDEESGGTLMRFHHKAFGVIPEDHRKGMGEGWTHINTAIRDHAERRK